MGFSRCFKRLQNLLLRSPSKMHLLAFLIVLLCALQCRSQCPTPVEASGVDDAQQQIILAKHNALRAKVANGQQGNLPKASNMLQMVWDPQNAAKAQMWANKCNFSHDTPADRDTGRGYTGQNLGYASNRDPNPDWNSIIQLFYDEVTKFNSSTIDNYVFDPATGHFTQVIWAKTYKIGCGYVSYKVGLNYIHLYGCNYLPGGNFVGSTVYLKGDPCSQCGGCGSQYGLCVGPP